VIRVLFVCTHNSARSQMAEGLLRRFGGVRFEASSAGTEPGRLHPLAVAAMAEAGIDISGHLSKSVESLRGQAFDCVITVCDQAKESCPVFPGARSQLHWSLPDPGAATGSEQERLDAFRRVRDLLRTRIDQFMTGAENDASHIRTSA
jgi:arsenate reductase